MNKYNIQIYLEIFKSLTKLSNEKLSKKMGYHTNSVQRVLDYKLVPTERFIGALKSVISSTFGEDAEKLIGDFIRGVYSEQ